MGLLFNSIFEFFRGGNPWGMARLPDGRGIFFPWITSAYLVPSDEIYHRIRRKMFLWEILLLPVGLCLGPAAIVAYLGELTVLLWLVGVFCSLSPMILIYVWWANKITMDLELYTGQDL
jgi:hypothetical protein